MDDHFLIQQVLAGNQNAFKFLVIRYQRPLFQFMGSFRISQARIEELAQETFVRAYKSLSSYDSKKSAFSSWLFTIAKNQAINELEKSDHKNEVHFEDRVSIEVLNHPDHKPSQETALETHQTEQQVRAAIDRLPKEFKSAVVLSYLQDLSMEDIAGIEKCSVGTVKSRIFRGKQILKSFLIQGNQRSEI